MADKLRAGWTPEFEKGMKQIRLRQDSGVTGKNTRIVIISGPGIKPNPVLKKYEVQYAEVPVGEFHNEKKHETKCKFFTNLTDAKKWVEDAEKE